MLAKNFFVYLLLIENGSYYCGYTDDVEKRFQKHLSGKGAKYTRANKPVKIVWQQTFATKSEALKAEHKIKNMTHLQKKELVEKNLTLIDLD